MKLNLIAACCCLAVGSVAKAETLGGTSSSHPPSAPRTRGSGAPRRAM